MTKNELKDIIRECVNEVMVNEGPILNMQEKAAYIVEKFREFYQSNSMRQYMKRKYSDNKLYSKEVIIKLGYYINREFFEKLDRKETPIPILFAGGFDSNTGAVYDLKTRASAGRILLNAVRSLGMENDGKYQVVSPDDFDYDDLMNLVEHELIHYEQHRRSGKGAYVMTDYSIELDRDPEVRQMLRSKTTKDSDESDEHYDEFVKYFNSKVELNTHAKDTANKFVKRWVIHLTQSGKEITPSRIKHAVQFVFKYPQSQESKIGVGILMKLFPGYKYLTPKNRKKWWNYVYKSILSMNFGES